MARSKTTTDTLSSNANTRPSSPFVAASRAKKGLSNAGLTNVREALKLHDLGQRFANPCVALGFFGRMVARPFSAKELTEFEIEGRTILLAFWIHDEVAYETKAGQEVIVSLPITHIDRLDRFHALGLKRTGLARAKGYVELRGTCDMEAVTRLVDKAGGTVVVIPRPAAFEPPVAEMPASAPTAEMASTLVSSVISEQNEESTGQNNLMKLAVSPEASSGFAEEASSPFNDDVDAKKLEQQNTPVDPDANVSQDATYGFGNQDSSDHVGPKTAPERRYQVSAQVIKKLIDDGMSEQDVPAFMRPAWREEMAKKDLKTLEKHTPGRPIPRMIRPPVSVTPRM